MRYYLYKGVFYDTNSLKHYGVLGMKWGVRRYQNKDGSLTATGKRRYSSGTRYGAENSDKTSERDHSKSNKSPLAWFATSAALDILALNPIGLAQDSIRLIEAGSSYVKAKVYDKERGNEHIDKETGFFIKSKNMSQEEDSARVNPLVHNFDENTKSNCMLCTATYDLRRRGYDVRARKASYGYLTDELLHWYPEAKINKISGMNENGKPSRRDMMEKVKTELVKQGEGARGNLMIRWPNMSGGHSVAYEIQNGNLKIIDAQINKIYSNPESFLRRCSADVEYARLDNVEFDKQKIKEVAE